MYWLDLSLSFIDHEDLLLQMSHREEVLRGWEEGREGWKAGGTVHPSMT